MTDDELVFATEDATPREGGDAHGCWKIAVVDDDESVRAITRLALGALRVEGRPLALLEADSADAGVALFAAHPDIALGLIDMVMETPDAGLRLIAAVREAQGNRKTRLVLRTGQPGQLAEDRLLREHDINDYREKTELSAQKLRTLAHSAIRNFRDIAAFEAAFRGIAGLLNRVLADRVAGHGAHAAGAAALASGLAGFAGLPATRVEALHYASTLHDIGLCALPAEVGEALLHMDVIDGEARALVELHAQRGAELLADLATEEGALAARLAREHHERWDGRGYPVGLAGEAIALESRILAVANLMDALLSAAPGRGPQGIDAVRGTLMAESGGALDPALVRVALEHFDALLARREAAVAAAP